MKLSSLPLFVVAVASGFSVPSKLYIRPSSMQSRRDLRHNIVTNHRLRETKLLYTKNPLLSRNESKVEDALLLQQGLASSDVDIEMPGSPTYLINEEADALFATLDPDGKVHHIDGLEVDNSIMRPPPDPMLTSWDGIKRQLMSNFGLDHRALEQINDEIEDKQSLLRIYESMQLARQFEVACNKQYMAGKIRGFMHLDNGQESIPAMVSLNLKKDDKKISYYREHAHALASGMDPAKLMAEVCMKDTGCCKGAGGSMHLYDKPNRFQGGWALVSEQLNYCAGAAKSILLDNELGLVEQDLENGDIIKVDSIQESSSEKGNDRIAVVFVGEGGSQNGRLPVLLNACSKLKLPILIVIIDNGRAINTFTEDVAANTMQFTLGDHYGIPGLLVDGLHAEDVSKAGRALTNYIRDGNGAAVMQIHTYRFMGHSPADPEHERGRKEEKTWAREHYDPIKAFEEKYTACGVFTPDELKVVKKHVQKSVNDAVNFAENSPEPKADLAKELEYPTPPGTDYNNIAPPSFADIVNERTISSEQIENINAHLDALREKAAKGLLTIAEAVNLALHEEMLRDPTTTLQAEDLQAGSSYGIPGMTQQTYGNIRASDEIIDEGHIIGKCIGEAMNGYRPIAELMRREP